MEACDWVTRAKSWISRKTRIPLIKSGRQREGRVVTGGGCLLPLSVPVVLVLAAAVEVVVNEGIR